MHTHVTGTTIGSGVRARSRARSGFVTWLAVAALAVLPGVSQAQEATVIGTVTDDSGGVLPGVVVTAIHEASGNRFEAVTEAGGGFRLPVRVGSYRLTAELEGFATLTRTGIEILVGQQATIHLRLVPASLSENVTVSASAPLLERTSSTVGSNVDPRQMAGAAAQRPELRRPDAARAGRPPERRRQRRARHRHRRLPAERRRPARHAEPDRRVRPAEVQPRRDRRVRVRRQPLRRHAGRLERARWSTPSPSRAPTRSSGTFSGYFRDDTFIAKDFVAEARAAVLGQQFSWTLGGPIMKDRLHFFGNYEYEREPQTFSHSSAVPELQLRSLGHAHREEGRLARLDFQFSPKTRLTVRGNKSLVDMPFDQRYTGGATRHPSSAITTEPAQQRPRRHADAGARLARGQRDPRRLRRLLLDPAVDRRRGRITRTPGLTHRHADHPAARLHHRPGAHQLARGRAAGHLRVRDNFTLSFSTGRPARREGRRRVLLPAEPGVPVQPLHGHLRRQGRRRSRPTSSRCSRCGTTSRPGTWRRCRRSSAPTRSASAR